jgi:hypothetical protein
VAGSQREAVLGRDSQVQDEGLWSQAGGELNVLT